MINQVEVENANNGNVAGGDVTQTINNYYNQHSPARKQPHKNEDVQKRGSLL